MSPHSENRRSPRRAFTLIELLVAMSVVLVLATVGFTAFPGVFEGQKEKKAAADIAVIQTALEQYRILNRSMIRPIWVNIFLML